MPSNPEFPNLSSLPIVNSFTEELPGDPDTDNYPREVRAACYSKVTPKPFAKAKLIAYSSELAEDLGLTPLQCTSPDFVDVFSGTNVLPTMTPFATCYGGHQFGHWSGQLGDGRAINLGEIQRPDQQQWSLQLKGSGPTPYSRHADGFAVLRSSVREFLCSEAMHALGVPTTRALSLMTTGEKVERDMFYDGHPKFEPGAVVCRVAPSFTRFGNFELLTATNQVALLEQLAVYTLKHNFPDIMPNKGNPGPKEYTQWFHQICSLTSEMVVHWMRVGFVHGVMNTDNMSILGLTIDYGPYGWLEDYNPNWTPNTTDAQGKRYRFGQQPQIALWNLLQLANAIFPLIGVSEPLTEALELYKRTYQQSWNTMMAEKLGLTSYQENSDNAIITDLVDTLQSTETDMTIFFRQLSKIPAFDANLPPIATVLDTPLAAAFYDDDLTPENVNGFDRWLLTYQQRLAQQNQNHDSRRQQMDAVNPQYVLRNYLAQLAIDKAEQDDPSVLLELMEVLKKPYQDQAGKEHLCQKRPEWARQRAGCSMLSCSS